MSRTVAILLLLASAQLTAGCSDLRYLARAAYEEARILAGRQPIEELLQGDVDETTRNRLELTLAARDFAAVDLGLKAGGSYSSVAQVGDDQIIHVVSAARRDRLEPYLWWFPIVGHVPYRGYFQEDVARSLANDLEGEGFDTYVRRALAFSTLGYFDDPLLSHLLRREPVDLVDTILHELLHSTFYASGQAAFNESFANFVGHRGAIAFFEHHGNKADARRARERWDDALLFSRLLASVIEELEAAYSTGIDDTAREQLFEQAKQRYATLSWKTNEYARFETAPLNNAVLLARRVYFERLELFEELYQRYSGDLAACIAWVGGVAAKHPSPFLAVEEALARPADAEVAATKAP